MGGQPNTDIRYTVHSCIEPNAWADAQAKKDQQATVLLVENLSVRCIHLLLHQADDVAIPSGKVRLLDAAYGPAYERPRKG